MVASYFFQKTKRLFLALTLGVGLSACSDESDSPAPPPAALVEQPADPAAPAPTEPTVAAETAPASEATSTPDTATTADSTESTPVPGTLGIVTGTLSLGAESGLSLGNMTIEVKDRPELKTTPNADGSFTIQGASPGTLTIFGLGEATDGLNLTTDSSAGIANYGIKIDDVVVGAGKTVELGEQILTPTGSLKGVVDFLILGQDSPELAGTDVYIPGTTWTAKTDSNGAFLIAGLPAGSYDLYIQRDGYALQKIQDTSIESDAIKDLGTVLLSLSDGPEGSISVTGTSSFTKNSITEKLSTSRNITLSLEYDLDARLMKVSDEPSFLNKSWVEVAQTHSISFDSDGYKTVYVQYSDENGLESSPYSVSFYIDTENPTFGNMIILNNWSQTATASTYIDLTVSDSGTGIKEVMFANEDESFAGAVWQAYDSRVNWTLSNSTGSKQVFAKIRDFANRESAVIYDRINVGAYTLVHAPDEMIDLRLFKTHSPYLLESSVTIPGQLIIDPGVSIELSGGITLFVNGKVTANGTASEKISIKEYNAQATDCSTGPYTSNIDFSGAAPGATEETSLSHIDFLNITEFKLSGGEVFDNRFEFLCNSGEGGGSLSKYGFDTLTVHSNTFVNYKTLINVTKGNGNTIVRDNTASVKNFLVQGVNASNTVVKDNTITMNNGTAIQNFSTGSVVNTNNTVTGLIQTVYWIALSADTTLDFSWLATSNIKKAINFHSTANHPTLTLNNLAMDTSCEDVALIHGTSPYDLVINNASFDGCNAIVDTYNLNGEDVSIEVTLNDVEASNMEAIFTPSGAPSSGGMTYHVNYSDLEFTNSLLEFSYPGGSHTLNVANSDVACVNGSGVCDMVYYKWINESQNPTLIADFDTSNITCGALCRGFTFHYNSSSPGTPTAQLDLASNHLVGLGTPYTFNQNNSSAAYNSTAIGSQSGDFGLFKFAGSATDFSFGGGSVIPGSISSTASPIAGTGPR